MDCSRMLQKNVHFFYYYRRMLNKILRPCRIPVVNGKIRKLKIATNCMKSIWNTLLTTAVPLIGMLLFKTISASRPQDVGMHPSWSAALQLLSCLHWAALVYEEKSKTSPDWLWRERGHLMHSVNIRTLDMYPSFNHPLSGAVWGRHHT